MAEQAAGSPGKQASSTRARVKTGLFWGAGSLFALFLGLVIVTGEWYRGVTALQQPPSRPELAGGSGGLRTLIWTDEGGVASSEAVRLWILCDNQTDGEVSDLKFLTFETPGFNKVPGCWQGTAPVCSPGGRKTGLPQRLEKQRTAVVYASLRPRHSFGRHGASGVLTWKDAQGRDFHRAVILPGLEVHSEAWDWISAFVKAVEICALPIVLAFLGWKLKRRDDQRAEEARVERERLETVERVERERREAAARADREWQIRLQETWSLQLNKSIENISTFYLPSVTAITKLLRVSSGLTSKSPESEMHHCLFAVLRVIRCMENPGGLIFKSRKGEDLAVLCWATFVGKIRSQLKTDEEGMRVEDAVHTTMSLAQFMDLVNGSPETALATIQRRRVAETLVTMTESLREWLDRENFQEDLAPLAVLLQILSFEMNRPLELWYGHLPEFPSQEFRKAVDLLPEDYRSLKAKLKDYQEECETEVEESSKRWAKTRPSGEKGQREGLAPGINERGNHE